MPLWIYHVLDVFFFVFHTGIILFNSFGWAFKKLRRYNLILLCMTLASWFILGIWYGWGYCVCTDWHWDVRRHLGYQDGTRSYIQLMLRKMGFDFSDILVDTGALVVLLLSVILSVTLNIRDYRRKKIEQ